jgi:hypothetical protein
MMIAIAEYTVNELTNPLKEALAEAFKASEFVELLSLMSATFVVDEGGVNMEGKKNSPW